MSEERKVIGTGESLDVERLIFQGLADSDFRGGGAVYNEGTFTATSCSFLENQASYFGGAVLSRDFFYADGCIFSQNVADPIYGSGVGGAIYVWGGSVEVNGSTFSANTAYAGGAVFNATSYTFTAKNTLFVNNSSTDGGSAAVDNYGTLLLENVTFRNNIGGAIVNNATATIKDSIFETSSDSICNNSVLTFQGTNTVNSAIANANTGVLTFQGTNTLNSTIDNAGVLTFQGANTLNSLLKGESGRAFSGADDTVLTGSGTISQTYIAQGYKTTLEGLTLDAQIIGGKVNEDVDSVDLTLKDITMTTNTKIYGAGVSTEDGYADPEIGNVAVNLTGTITGGKNGAVYAGGMAGAESTITVGTVSLNVDVTGKVGVLFAGAELAEDGDFEAEAVNTTIENGTFLGWVGNGCYHADGSERDDELITTDIDATSLSINGGTFNNLVYAGAFADGDAIVVGGEPGDARKTKEDFLASQEPPNITVSTLTINGGTFKNMVFGGNGGLNADCTKETMSYIEGNVEVKINASTNSPIRFERSLLSGSVGEGYIFGNTTMTFSGSGDALSFGAEAYVSGGSQRSWHKNLIDFEDYVYGKTSLVFDGFNGGFSANMRNGFTNVEFKGSSVSFGGTVVDLSCVKEWIFDASDAQVDLTWTQGTNDFFGDTIKVTGWDGETTKELMVGSEETLMNWSGASVLIDSFIGHLECNDNKLMIVAGAVA